MLGLEGWCVLYACTAPGPAVLFVVVQTSSSLAEGLSVVCPSPFVAEGTSFFCRHNTWFGRNAVGLIGALGYAGWAALVIHLCLGRRTGRYFVAVA